MKSKMCFNYLISNSLVSQAIYLPCTVVMKHKLEVGDREKIILIHSIVV